MTTITTKRLCRRICVISSSLFPSAVLRPPFPLLRGFATTTSSSLTPGDAQKNGTKLRKIKATTTVVGKATTKNKKQEHHDHPHTSSATHELNNNSTLGRKNTTTKQPHGFWRDKQNHRRFFDRIAKQLNIRDDNLDSWYEITVRDVYKLGGHGLLNYYKHSLQQALASVYPEHEWLPWKFRQVSDTFWLDKQNQRKFFDWAAKQLNIRDENLDGWYAITIANVYKLGGRGLLKHYNDSLQQALASVYPEHEWLPWRFQHTANGFWSDKQNHRRFFDWAEKQLGITTVGIPSNDNNSSSSEAEQRTWEGWYSISREQVYALGGSSIIIKCYDGSLLRALAAVYPEREWDPWRFQRCRLPDDELVDKGALRRFVEGPLMEYFQVQSIEDWYRVSTEQARAEVEGYATVVDRHGGLAAVLKQLYPEHEWDDQKLRSSDKRSSQRMLRLATQKLFPGEEVVEEYHHPSLHFKDCGIAITFDIWVPSLSLALEYQGEQHYRDVYVMGDSPVKQQSRDQEKAEACRDAGITLVVVPYWWSKKGCSADKLAAIIAEVNPGLLTGHGRASLSLEQPAAAEDR